MKKYPSEIDSFIREHCKGIGTSALVRLINARFGTEYTYKQIKAYKGNHHLASGARPGRQEDYYSTVFPKEICDLICAWYKGIGPSEMAVRLNEKCGTTYSADQLKGFYHNHHLNSGVTGRYEPGHVPANKGVKGICHPGSVSTQFKKGQVPYDLKPVGAEVFRPSDGYWWVKIAEPNKWQMKHIVLWEREHGKRPPNTVIIFLDGDRSNFAESNLKLISKAENAVMNRFGFRRTAADFTETGLLMAKVKIAKAAAAKRYKKGKSNAQVLHSSSSLDVEA